MEKNGTIEIVDQFQDAFARVFEDQIQQLIQDSRKEALAAAKQILRENALHNVLEAVVGSAGGNDIAKSDIAIADLANSRMHSANEAVSSRAVPYEAVATVDVGTVVEKTTSSPAVVELPVKPSRIKAKPETATRSKEAGSAPPMLNDRILEEIEAIREQIRRNELLLSQIKPFVQLSKVQDE